MNEPRFRIDGADYPVPGRASLNLDEHVIFHEWTNLTLEEIDDTPINALMIGAFMQIAYLRANPDMSPQLARKMIGKANLEEALSAMAAAEQEDDPVPLEQTPSAPEPNASPGNSGSSPSISGEGSTTRSDPPASPPSFGGTPPSAIHVTSGQTRSAA